MELRQLEYFLATCRYSSVTQAAESLRVAQPSVTVAIRKLEEEFRVTLFDRSKKQIALTAEGQVLLRHAEAISGRVQDAVKELADYQTLRRGSVTVGIPPMVGAFLFPLVFAGFQRAYPQFEIKVVEQGSLAIRGQLVNGELDVGIAVVAGLPAALETAPITSGQLVVCMASSHRLGGLEKVSFAELRDEPFVLLKEDTYSRRTIMEECRKHGFSPRVVFSSGQIDTILGLVRQDVGVSFLFDAVVRRHPDILHRPLAEPLISMIGVVWNRERYLSRAARAFIDFIASSFPQER